ncbi:hypothetical protein [Limnobaculum xujianqingii]|uniref:hypothetical protein n=1 Tax=Limnobaculum xujianqingii TaxID=2738837 RepID=UPI00112773E5|nr:hypothetical protein [Limnobaculum xujianqingii]
MRESLSNESLQKSPDNSRSGLVDVLDLRDQLNRIANLIEASLILLNDGNQTRIALEVLDVAWKYAHDAGEAD